MRRHPLIVTVIWTDAATITDLELPWDPAQVGREVDLCRDRHTVGFFVYVDADKLILAKDYDAESHEVGSFTVIPVGWIDRVYSHRRTLYRRKVGK